MWESLEWEEVPMWKALKIWASNERHIKCTEGNIIYHYHGQEAMNKLRHSQVKNGKWFIEKK